MDLIPVAARRMPIMREGKRVMVEPGDPVPEAAAWSHVKAWERQGYIRWVPAPPDLAAKMKDQAAPTDGQPPDPGDPVDSPVEPAAEVMTFCLYADAGWPSPEPMIRRSPRAAAKDAASARQVRRVTWRVE